MGQEVGPVSTSVHPGCGPSGLGEGDRGGTRGGGPMPSVHRNGLENPRPRDLPAAPRLGAGGPGRARHNALPVVLPVALVLRTPPCPRIRRSSCAAVRAASSPWRCGARRRLRDRRLRRDGARRVERRRAGTTRVLTEAPAVEWASGLPLQPWARRSARHVHRSAPPGDAALRFRVELADDHPRTRADRARRPVHARRRVVEPRGAGLVAPAAAPREPARVLRRRTSGGTTGRSSPATSWSPPSTPTSTTSVWPTCTGPTSSTGETGGHGDRGARRRRHRPARAAGNRAAARRSRRPRAPDRRRRARAPGSRPTWTEPDGRPGRLDVVGRAAGGPRVAQRRHPVERRAVQLHVEAPGPSGGGELVVGDRRWAIGGRTAPRRGACSTSVGAGGPSEIRWNWGGGAGRVRRSRRRPAVRRQVDRGHRLHRERPDRRRPAHEARSELRWDYDWDEPMRAVARRAIPAVSSTSC